MTESFELPERLSRREFLGLSGMSLLAMAVPFHWIRPRMDGEPPTMGRVVDPTLVVYHEPSFSGRKVKTLWRDDVFDIDGALIGDTVPEHNRIWYRVRELGYAHSSAIQPVSNRPNQVLEHVAAEGTLMEVTIPYVDAHWKPREDSDLAYRFYYGTTFWITGVSQDVKLQKWYRILDDKYAYVYYARAEAFRPVPATELIPISPDVPARDKRIVVDLGKQWIECFEGSQLVFISKVSTGRKFGEELYWTPEGDFITFRKRPSRHMAQGNLASGYDLPGVPWVAYITEDGVSFHGTYWHNDFGTPRSHGCINMTLEAAKWLYRWTRPVVPAWEEEVWVSYGTSVKVQL